MKYLLLATCLMALNFCNGQDYKTWEEYKSRQLLKPIHDTTVGVIVWFDHNLSIRADSCRLVKTAYTESMKYGGSEMTITSWWEPYWLTNVYYLINGMPIQTENIIKFNPSKNKQ